MLKIKIVPYKDAPEEFKKIRGRYPPNDQLIDVILVYHNNELIYHDLEELPDSTLYQNLEELRDLIRKFYNLGYRQGVVDHVTT